MGRARQDSLFGVDMEATMENAMGIVHESDSEGSDDGKGGGSGGSGSEYSGSSSSSNSDSDSSDWSSDYSSEEFTESSDSEDEDVDPNDRVLLIYRKLMSKAGISRKHASKLPRAGHAESVPLGRVSKVIYDKIERSHPYDRYGRPRTPPEDEDAPAPSGHHRKKKGLKKKKKHRHHHHKKNKHRKLKSVVPSQEIQAAMNEHVGASPKKRERKKYLLENEKELIAPPGYADQVRIIKKSHGNEKFYNYDGRWKKGMMHGQGVYKFADGSVYKGTFENNRPHGKGKVHYRNKMTYEGEWREGKFHGKGKTTSPYGTTYVGDFVDGLRHGQGKITFPHKQVFEGTFFRGVVSLGGTGAGCRPSFAFGCPPL